MYTTIETALARAKERSGATAADDAYLTELLQMSAGTAPNGTTVYRPFWCAAKHLEQNRSIQAIKVADGATFTGQATPIASLLAQQASLDNALNLTIPEGFEAVTAAVATTVIGVQRFGTRSYTNQVRP